MAMLPALFRATQLHRIDVRQLLREQPTVRVAAILKHSNIARVFNPSVK
jgi:hypothetical protein